MIDRSSSCVCRAHNIFRGVKCLVTTPWLRVFTAMCITCLYLVDVGLCIHSYVHDLLYSWLMQVYARDILSRLPQLLAMCTAVFGRIIKIDSAKKVCKKLLGTATGSASYKCAWTWGMRKAKFLSLFSQSQEAWKAFVPWPWDWLNGLSCMQSFVHFRNFTQVSEGQAGSPTAAVH